MHTSCGFLWGNRMKTKREILKSFALNGTCEGISCSLCPYDKTKECTECLLLSDNLIRIGAKAILRMFPEKREFDIDKILTCVTADKAKVGMRGYFGDTITLLKERFQDKPHLLTEIRDEDFAHRFVNEYNTNFSLFYPVDEVEE